MSDDREKFRPRDYLVSIGRKAVDEFTLPMVRGVIKEAGSMLEVEVRRYAPNEARAEARREQERRQEREAQQLQRYQVRARVKLDSPNPNPNPNPLTLTLTLTVGGASRVTGNTIRDGSGGSLCLSLHSKGTISSNVIHQHPKSAMQVS